MSNKRTSFRPDEEWKDSYFSLEERYRQLQKKMNEKEKELQLAKVAERRASGSASLQRARASLRGRGRGRGRGPRYSVRSVDESIQPSEIFSPNQSIRSATGEPMEVNTEYLSVPSVARPDSARAAAISEAAAWSPDSMLPDPAMIWGAEGSIQNYVAASALYHANEDLRKKLEESTTMMKTLQHELSSSRTLSANIQTKLDDCTQRMHQLIRERDLTTQKYESARATIEDFERIMQNRMSEENKIKFSLESQVAELRSRLVAGADNNELLSRDVRTLLTEARDKSGEVMALRSKLAILESSYRSQKSTNENLLVELKNLNQQLIHERKRIVLYARDVQEAGIQRDRVAELEERARLAADERNELERSYVKLMGDFVKVTEDALRHAREEVKQDLHDWKEAATHWEDVAQLLYKDIAQRTQNHIKCRAECEEAKAQRDSVSLALRAAKESLGLSLAKLRVVWPSHESDTAGLSEEDILQTFGVKNRFRVRVPKRKGEGDEEEVDETERKMGETNPTDPPALLESSGRDVDEEKDVYEEVLLDLPYDPASQGERVRELHEANAGLMAELAQVRLSNELLQTRIESLTGRRNTELAELEQKKESLEQREAATQRILDSHLDRVRFLETQVQSLRGYSVDRGVPLDNLSSNENVFELFLGQLVAQEVPEGVSVPEMFSAIFITADFLLHETVTSPTINGLNGFFDTTISFQIAMDTLLLYYLQTRNLLVQLHRVRSEEEIEEQLQEPLPEENNDQQGSGSSSDHTSLRVVKNMYETIAEGQVNLLDIVLDEKIRNAERPLLKGHIKFFTPTGRHLASLEFHLTARAPFSEEFRRLASSFVPENTMPPSTSTAVVRQLRERHMERDWISECSSLSDRRPPKRSHLQIVPTGSHSNTSPSQRYHDRTVASTPYSDSYLEGSSTNSSNTNKRRQLQRFADPPAPPPGTSPIEARYTPSQPRNPPIDQGYTPSSIGQLPSPWTNDFNSPSRFTHLSPSMLGRNNGGSSKCSITVEVERVELPADYPGRLPRLSCFFSLPALRKEVRLPAPTQPRFTVLYSDSRVTFDVHSLRELGQVCREPLTLFFMDEDASKADELFALAICEWSTAMEKRGETLTFNLPLLGRDRTVIKGGLVNVTVCANDGDNNNNNNAVSSMTAERSTLVNNTLPVLDYSRSPMSSSSPPQGDASMVVPGLNRENATRTIEEELMRMDYERMGQ